jgi:PilZ domain-containing protein
VLKKVSEEKRRSGRKRLFLRGFVRTPRGKSSIDCMVRDLSDVGAKLRFRCTPLITDFFELHIPAMGTVLQSKLVWMNNCEAGVSFDPIAAVGAVPAGYGEVSARVTAIEDEITELKDMLKLLQRRLDKVG